MWVATWGGPYQYKTTANYLMAEYPGHESTNPLPVWSHLIMTHNQMREYLIKKSIPEGDIDCILDFVFFGTGQINRLNMSEIAEAYTNSKLIVLEANTSRIDVPPGIQEDLRKCCGEGVDYGICGVTYLLAKPK